MMYTRQEVSHQINDLLQTMPEVIAAWEGGSAATGYLDAFSDLDLSIVCVDSAVESVFEHLQNLLERQFGIRRFYRIPEPAWHGFSQCFYQINQVPELFYLDIAVIKQSLPDKFTASDRHGNAVVWFEKKPMINPSPSPSTTIDALCRRIYKAITQLDFLLELEVRKALARQVYSEAFYAYYSFMARVLVPMMNIKYRPAKADFGFRYIYRDYPKALADLIENSLKATTVTDLNRHFSELVALYHSLKSELISFASPAETQSVDHSAH